MADVSAVSAAITGATLGLTLIVAIGAQNAFVLRQGLRREHVGAIVAFCALADALLMVAATRPASGGSLGHRPPPRVNVALGLPRRRPDPKTDRPAKS